MSKKCERCGARPTLNPADGTPDLLDYCGVCSKDLCAECMGKGCCGNVPAISGTSEDDDDGPGPGDTD